MATNLPTPAFLSRQLFCCRRNRPHTSCEVRGRPSLGDRAGTGQAMSLTRLRVAGLVNIEKANWKITIFQFGKSTIPKMCHFLKFAKCELVITRPGNMKNSQASCGFRGIFHREIFRGDEQWSPSELRQGQDLMRRGTKGFSFRYILNRSKHSGCVQVWLILQWAWHHKSGSE